MKANELTLQFGRLKNGTCDVFLTSSFGDASGVFHQPFSEAELGKMNNTRWLMGLAQALGGLAAKVAGTRLFEAVFRDRIYALFTTTAAMQAGKSTVLKLKFHPMDQKQAGPDDFGLLFQLPWEAVYDPYKGGYVGSQPGWSVVRHLASPQGGDPPPQVPPPFRILPVLASPAGYQPLDIDTHLQSIKETVGQQKGIVIQQGHVSTWSGLSQALIVARNRGEPIHAVHFFLHGTVADGVGQIVMQPSRAPAEEKPDGHEMESQGSEPSRGDIISADQLANILTIQPDLQFIFLGSCMGGQIEQEEENGPYLGLATSLVRKGFPNVIAMSREITQQSLNTFTAGFYGAFTKGKTLSEAMAAGRHKIFAGSPHNDELTTPMLFSRASAEGLPTIHWPFFKKVWTAIGLILSYLTLGYIALGQSGDIAVTFPLFNEHRRAAAVLGIGCCGGLYLVFMAMTLYYARRSEATSWFARIPEFWNATWNWAHPSSRTYQIFVVFFFIAIPTYGQLYFANRFFTGTEVWFLPKRCTNIECGEFIKLKHWTDHFKPSVFTLRKDGTRRPLFTDWYRYSAESITYYPVVQPIVCMAISLWALWMFVLVVFQVWLRPRFATAIVGSHAIRKGR